MENKSEMVIRWLEEPKDAACALCEGKKPMKFEKGPVVSMLISSRLDLPRVTPSARFHNMHTEPL